MNALSGRPSNNPNGRNSLYTPQVLKDTQFYLDYFKDLGHVVPSIQGLARYLKIGLSTIKGWCHDDDKREFMATLEDIKTEQAHLLINQGLDNKFNSCISKLMLANHGYHDRAEVANYDGNTSDKQWSVESVTPDQQRERELLDEGFARLEKEREQLKKDSLLLNAQLDNLV